MDFNFTAQQKAVFEKCQHLAEKEIAPHISKLEEDLLFREKVFRKMAQEGLFSLAITPSIDTISYVLALTAIAKADAGMAVAMAVTNMVAEAIQAYGTEKQKSHFLPLISSGDYVPASFALTEKTAGSDAKNIQSRVKRIDHHHFLLNGDKQFITNGDLAGVLIVMAKIDSSKDSHGITAFLIEKGTPGFSVVKKENKVGLLTAHLVDLRFEDCKLRQEQILGEEGKGLTIALSSLDRGRIGIAAQAVGIAEAAFETALAYAKKREQFGRPIIEHEAIGFKLADMHVKLNAAKQLLWKAAWTKDQGHPFTLQAAEAKLFCSEVCNQIANEALQIHGGYGYVKDYPLEKYWRDARATTIYEGTSEIQRLVISRQLRN